MKGQKNFLNKGDLVTQGKLQKYEKEWENQKSLGNKPLLKFDKLFGLSLYCGVYFQLNEETVEKSKKYRKRTLPKI